VNVPGVRWQAADGALGHPVSRGIVLSAARDEFAVILHPGDVVWALFAEARSLDDVIAVLRDEGASDEEARVAAVALVDDLVARGLLERVPRSS
jgi:hypothetical protein